MQQMWHGRFGAAQWTVGLRGLWHTGRGDTRYNDKGALTTVLITGLDEQDFVEETAEYQVGVDDTARRRKLRLNRRQAIVQEELEPVPVREAVVCYCKCMQVMLQASCAPGKQLLADSCQHA